MESKKRLKVFGQRADKGTDNFGRQPEQCPKIKTRKRGMPRQRHIIPELEYPATSRQGRIEDRLIRILDRR